MISRDRIKNKRLLNRIASLFICLVITSASVISGQDAREQAPPLRERLFFGGSLGLQFGTITDIQVAPMVGLWVLPRLAVAVGPNYRYYKDPVSQTALYGGNAYLQYVVVRDIGSVVPLGIHTGIFLHLEDELLSLESAFWDPSNPYGGRFALNTLLAGAGISQPLGARSSVNLMFLWALNDSGYGLYSSPEIRVSFSF
jgi:hypothetical protein